jgi:GT2 family glycosyltransferase
MIPHHFMESLFATTQRKKYDLVVNPFGSGPNIASGRNYLVQRFLESPCDYFLSVDTDIVWHPEHIDDLMAHDKDVVSGLYHSWGEKGIVWPVYLKEASDGTYERATLDDVEGQTELMEVAAVGMGLCLIKRKVFEELGASLLWPFAETLANNRYQGEDVTFCTRAREKGFGIYLDPTVEVPHSKLQPVRKDVS